MLIDLHDIIGDLPPLHGVVHVGAHLGEEAELYESLHLSPVNWVEANGDVMPHLVEVCHEHGHNLCHALLLDSEREVTFRITNYDGMSSSVYPWGTHTQFSPDTVIERTETRTSTTLDALAQEVLTGSGVDLFGMCNMLNVDVEGATLDVLRGGPKTLEHMDVLYLEVQTENVYDGAPLLDEVMGFLHPQFHMIELKLVEGQGWGDSVWVR